MIRRDHDKIVSILKSLQDEVMPGGRRKIDKILKLVKS